MKDPKSLLADFRARVVIAPALFAIWGEKLARKEARNFNCV